MAGHGSTEGRGLKISLAQPRILPAEFECQSIPSLPGPDVTRVPRTTAVIKDESKTK